MRRSRWSFWLGMCVFGVGACGVLVLVCLFAQTDNDTQKLKGTVEPPKRASVVPVIAPKIHRIRVAGAPGYFVVVQPDGSSIMEDPDGKQTQLTSAGDKVFVENAVVGAIDRITQPSQKVEVGQLIVCARGIVGVPKNAIITLIADDKVVTHSYDGYSTVYFTDGRVVKRDRIVRAKELP